MKHVEGHWELKDANKKAIDAIIVRAKENEKNPNYTAEDMFRFIKQIEFFLTSETTKIKVGQELAVKQTPDDFVKAVLKEQTQPISPNIIYCAVGHDGDNEEEVSEIRSAIWRLLEAGEIVMTDDRKLQMPDVRYKIKAPNINLFECMRSVFKDEKLGYQEESERRLFFILKGNLPSKIKKKLEDLGAKITIDQKMDVE